MEKGLPPIERALQTLAVNAMAYEVVLLALMRSHPDAEALRDAVQKQAVETSIRAMTGQQLPGVQEAFDAKIQQMLGLSERRC